MPYTADAQVWNWSLIAGDTAQPAVVRLVDEAGDPYDLTGVTGEGQVRRDAGSDTLILALTVTLVDASDGTFTWTAAAEDTEEIAAGDYAYAIRLTWPDDTGRRTVLIGTLSVRASVVH